MQTAIQAIYEHGMLKPRKKLPIREHAKVTLIVQPADPVSKTRRQFPVSKKLAKVLIYDDSLQEA
ncbi:MAG: hypothetical protein A2992_07450 [Elusimicrobia bacterium RIFCSPLOWO2_01_FULL_59_12]|nr:MAG: hypothetical protein A2992_07450 [Elusimicrobia bacterium RIFCSPLOWO2_01_FULL_59_12]